mgnify:CR=1 FL=1
MKLNSSKLIIFVLFFIFLLISFFIGEFSFNYGDGPRDILIFIDQLYRYILENNDQPFREYILQRYETLIKYSGLESNHPSIPNIETTIFFDRDQYRLLIFFPLLFLKSIFINLSNSEILFLNNLLFIFFSITVIYFFGKKIHSNTFGIILTLVNIFNYYFLQLFWSSAENYIFYYIPLFYLNMIFVISLLQNKTNKFKVSSLLIFSILMLFLNGYPNTILSLISFIYLFALIYDYKNILSNFINLTLNVLIALIIFFIISYAYSNFIGEVWYYQLNSVFFRFNQLYQFIVNNDTTVSSLSFSFNFFDIIKNISNLLFVDNKIYISPHESGYLINKSFLNNIEIFFLLLSILFLFRIIKYNFELKILVITSIFFFIIRMTFDANLVIGKSNYDYIFLILFFVSIGATHLFSILVKYLLENKDLINFSINKIVIINYFKNTRIRFVNLKIFTLKKLITLLLLFLLFPASLILNIKDFNQDFFNKNFKSIGSLNGLDQVVEYIKNNKSLNYVFNFNDYHLHNASRILFNSNEIKLLYDDNKNIIDGRDFVYVTPDTITNYPLYNRFNPSAISKFNNLYYLLPHKVINSNKNLYYLYKSENNILKTNKDNFKFDKTINFDKNYQILSSNFYQIDFTCSNSNTISFFNELNYFDNTVIDFINYEIISETNPFKSSNLSLNNLIISENNKYNNYSNNEFKTYNVNQNANLNLEFNFKDKVKYLEIYFPFYFYNRGESQNEIKITSRSNIFKTNKYYHKTLNDEKLGTFRFLDGNFSDVTFYHEFVKNIYKYKLNIFLSPDIDANDIIIPMSNIRNNPKTKPFSSIKVVKSNKVFFEKMKACNVQSIDIKYNNKKKENYIIIKND